MVNYGNGFTWNEVYTTTIHWRRFYFKKLIESKKKEKEEYDKSNKKKRGPKCKSEEVIFLTFFYTPIFIVVKLYKGETMSKKIQTKVYFLLQENFLIHSLMDYRKTHKISLSKKFQKAGTPKELTDKMEKIRKEKFRVDKLIKKYSK